MGIDPTRIIVIDPADRSDFDSELASGASNYDYYICHWDVLIRLDNLVPERKGQGIRWDHLIADEVHLAKSRKALRTKALKKINARVRTGLSGTPADDKPQDLWSVLNWLYPREWSAYWKFFDHYLDSKTGYSGYREIVGTKNIPELHDRIRPYYIRRLLTDVVDDMPEKSHSIIRVKLLPKQRRDYAAMLKDQVARLDGGELISSIKMVMYMRLIQMTLGTCSLDWRLFEEGRRDSPVVRIGAPSPKLDVLMELILDHEDEQFVVFTNFKDVANLVEEKCKEKQITISKITGEVHSQHVRDASVAEFQSGNARVFVGTIAAAGTTITLTAAHTVIFLDRNWNPSKNQQAEDRIWRIGQKNACQIIDIIAEDTIDEPRLQEIFRKADSIDEVVNI